MRKASIIKAIAAMTAVIALWSGAFLGWGGSDINVKLGIPARLQWNNSEGFCGETGIQMAALYYGTYISQYQVRKLSGGELLVSENDGPVYQALGLKTDIWDAKSEKPQSRSYLQWIKAELLPKNPVLMTVFIRGMHFQTYDHIVPVGGFQGQSDGAYHPEDQISFYDNFKNVTYTRTFSSLPDDRAMKGNGAVEKYCVPQEVDYGCAVTGIRDDNKETLPVRLWLDSWSEPNITLKATAKIYHAAVVVRGMRIGEKYLLLRYNDPKKLPASGFAESNADKTVVFTATKESMTFYDGIRSDSIAIYRCVPQK